MIRPPPPPRPPLAARPRPAGVYGLSTSRLRGWRTALACLCGLLASIVLSAGASPAPVQEQDFLLIVKQLADSGKLTDADEAARLLKTTLTSFNDSFTDYSLPRFGPCKLGKLKSAEDHQLRPADDFWYKPQLPPGVRGTFFNGASFSYSISKTLSCVGRDSVDPKYSAMLYFFELSSFVCVTTESLKSTFPGIVLVRGTDGGQDYNYRGFTSEDSGTFVTFGVPAPCSSGVSVIQDYRYGARAQRAYTKLSACLRARLEADSKKYPDTEYCGTFWELYEKE